MEVKARETVVLAVDQPALVQWYVDVLGFTITRAFSESYHYTNLRNTSGIELGIAVAEQMGVQPLPLRARHATVLLQFAVADVKGFLAHIEANGGAVTLGPSFDERFGFWYGGFTDPEGNPYWIYDENCP